MSDTFSVSQVLAKAQKSAAKGDLVAAAECFLSVLDRFPGNKKARLGLKAHVPKIIQKLLSDASEAQLQKNWPRVESRLSLALRLGADDLDLRFGLAAARLELGATPASLEDISFVLDSRPEDLYALNIKGRALREMTQPRPALESFHVALSIAPEDPKTLNNIGLTLRAMGDFNGAADHFLLALKSDPDNPTIHYNLAQVTRFDRMPDRLELLTKALTKIVTRPGDAMTGT